MLGVLWWSWGGYAWLTSVVDPEEGAVRIAIFAAMAAFLVAALAVPDAFGDDALRSPARTGSSASPTSGCSRSRAATIRAAPVRDRGSREARQSASRCSSRPRRPTGSRRARSGRSRIASTSASVSLLRRGLAADARALRGAARADRDHRARRVDRRDRGRRRTPSSTAAWSRRGARRSRVAAALWWLYFDVDRSGRRAPALAGHPGGSRTSSRVTRTRSSTSRWSRGSCCRVRAEEDARARDDPLESCPPPRSSAASRCTSWPRRVPLAPGAHARPAAVARRGRGPRAPVPRRGRDTRVATVARVVARRLGTDRLRGRALRRCPRGASGRSWRTRGAASGGGCEDERVTRRSGRRGGSSTSARPARSRHCVFCAEAARGCSAETACSSPVASGRSCSSTSSRTRPGT